MKKQPKRNVKIPAVGFGTARIKGEECERIILDAIKVGYRHFDCASFYGNEAHIGKAIQNAIQSNLITHRSDLFLTSKLWNDDHHPSSILGAIQKTLDNLQTDYLDLYLMHWPVSWKKGTLGCIEYPIVSIEDSWREMERLVMVHKLTRYIGVSNFGIKRLRHLMNISRYEETKPVVNQLEIHPYLNQELLIRQCSEMGVKCVAWSPLAKYSSGLMKDGVIQSIVDKQKNKKKKNGLSASQVVLCWHLQRGVIVIPRSTNPEHMADNLKVMNNNNNRALSDEDMKAISMLNRDERLFRDWVGVFEETPFWPYHIIGYVLRVIGWMVWSVLPHVFDFSNPQRWSVWEVVDRERQVRFIDRIRIVLWIVLFFYWIFVR